MSAVWKNLEGHVINDVFPLHRCIASSDRSAVFTTESAKHAPSTLALKLVRFDPAFANAQLSRWVAAVEFAHPHLIRMFEAGRCHIGELHCVYALMEYADQNLAQLLEQRALVEDEVREILLPTLSSLAYLHERKFVQGQLKPSNILAVGEQLKLASDTVRAIGGSAGGLNTDSAYDAPEACDRTSSAADDIWALGVTMCEALTRRRPSGLHAEAANVELPFDLHPPFREIVARCLKRNPRDRPDVAELQAWLRGEHAMGAATASLRREATSLRPSAMSERANDQPIPSERSVAQIAAVESVNSQAASAVPVESQSNKPATVRLVIRAEIISDRDSQAATARQPLNRRALLVLGAVAVLTLSWVGTRVFSTDPTPTPGASEGARDVEPPLPALASAPSEAPVVSTEPLPKPAASAAAKTVESEARGEPDAPSPVNEVIPDVPRSALQTIRGTIRVSVRVTIDKEGTVVAATPRDRGPSRYFERLAIEASKKWTFAPADTEAQRMMLVRFNFTRAGTTARASPLP